MCRGGGRRQVQAMPFDGPYKCIKHTETGGALQRVADSKNTIIWNCSVAKTSPGFANQLFTSWPIALLLPRGKEFNLSQADCREN